MAKMGRPRVEIDWDNFEKMCKMLCTAEEMAQYHQCSTSTIARAVQRKYGTTFEEVLKSYGAHAKVALRRTMMQVALKENRHQATMLIYLDKKHLGGLPTEQIDGRMPVPITNFTVTNSAIASGISTKDLLAKALDRPKMITEGED